ncbi:Two-component response regulator-like APRR2 [Quillaja saponaria]|uniref:Two-component response regulator-like APRR2 n=1 Tax=Quillaja saponaria TaxID=32244 RepID=A0AAD7L049_QUISA|nr:Two-component response regulator-like APRR2 [Quillaja saponaria]
MLAVSPLRNTKYENQNEMESFSIGTMGDFPEFSDGSLLDSINFDDLFVGINVNDADILPDLEMDREILAKFSLSGGQESEITSSVSVSQPRKEDEDKAVVSSGLGSGCGSGNFGLNYEPSRAEEIVSKRDESIVVNPVPKGSDKGRKSSSQSKNSQGKRKMKVDWTPELHRRFVQAVEQLGVDKAVPSRILEIMGIDCLTRHNIASHLQKYRSHRKHLLAREAEAASWSQRRQIYGGGGGGGGGGGKRDLSPWIAGAPTMGFPPVNPMHHFRPLHVWGHPTMDQSLIHMWPKHLAHSPSPQRAWASPPPPPPLDPSYWHAHHQRGPNPLTAGTLCFPQPLPTTRFASSHVPGIPPVVPHAMFKAATGQPRPLFDFHPSKESVDAVIGDVLTKPWQPLPLGLKPPALDSVMGELQRQGVPKIPPSCA